MNYRRTTITTLCSAVIFSCGAPVIAADLGNHDFIPGLSLQGYTGILNTPSATVTSEGTLDFAYSNQTESQWRNRTSSQDSYAFSLGLFSLLEIGGRVIEAPRVARDLSANIKLTSPRFTALPYLPTIAFGIQDMGGGSRFLQNRYLVSSLDLWRFRLSGGYGFGPDRMKGGFAGAEFKAHDWVYLLGEYDTRETNLGVRLVSPPLLGMPLHLHATVKTALDYKPGEPEIAFGIQIPLGGAPKQVPPVNISGAAEHLPSMVTPQKQDDRPQPPNIANNQPQQLRSDTTTSKESSTTIDQYVSATQRKLVETGFQNVRFAIRNGNILMVEYENPIFSHNELDGMGVVAGSVLQEIPAQFTKLELTLRKADLIIAVVEAPTALFRSYLATGNDLALLKETIQLHRSQKDGEKTEYLSEAANTTPFSTRLELSPGLSTFVATEVGVFDYLLSLKPDLYVNLWKGAVAQLRADLPLAWSDNLDDGKPYRSDRNNARFDRALLHQTFALPASVTARIAGGLIVPDTYGTNNELAWNPGDGTHSFQVYQSLARHSKSGVTTDYSAYTAGYRYYFAPLDTSLRLDGGRFWTKDTGFTIELKRFFSDVSTTIYYKNSQLPNHGGNVQAGGITFELPLTFRKEITRPPIQITGNNEWSYSQQSLIVTPGQSNFVSVASGVRPQISYNLMHNFANRDRLSEGYLKNNLTRLRDAWLKYGEASTATK